MNWTQKDNRVWVESVEGKFYFDMPEDFDIQGVHPDLLRLSEILMFGYWQRELFDYKFTRYQGYGIGLALSGGVDSVVAGYLMPEGRVVGVHHKRATQGEDSNSIYAVNNCGLPYYIVESNFEQVRTHYGYGAGYQTDLCLESIGTTGLSPLIPIVLMADYLNLGYLAMGVVLHSGYLDKNVKYRAFHKSIDWLLWQQVFKSAGLSLYFPVMPCAALGVVKTWQQMGVYAQSCTYGKNGHGCGACYKCVQKELLQGRVAPITESVKKSIRNKMRVAMLMSGVNEHKLDIQELSQYKGLNTDCLSRYYKPALSCVPEEFREHTEGRLGEYIRPMADGEFESFNSEGVL